MAVILTRDAIFAAPIPTKEVEAFGGTVQLRALSAKSKILLLDVVYANEAKHTEYKMDQELPEDQRKGVERVDLYDQTMLSVMYSICDEHGEALFTVEDYDKFLTMDYVDISRLWFVIQELNFRDPESQKKSSASTRKGGSSSGSRRASVRR